jgi:hypothetical protein
MTEQPEQQRDDEPANGDEGPVETGRETADDVSQELKEHEEEIEQGAEE